MTDDELKGLFEGLRQDVRGEIAELRQDVRGEIAELRQDNVAIRGEIAELRQDNVAIRGEIADTRREMGASADGLRAEIRLVAEAVVHMREDLVRRFDELGDKIDRGLAETQALIRSHIELNRGTRERLESSTH